MPKNKKESVIFTLMMCVMMVFGMTVYNTFLQDGVTGVVSIEMLIGFVPAFFIALILDVWVVGPNAKKLAFKLLGENKGKMPMTAIVVSCCMVAGMVMCMSVFGLIVQRNFSGNIFFNYLQTVLKNALCAFPLQLLVVGPISRFILKSMSAEPVQS